MTELGEIPEEWKVLNIEECANDIFLGLTSKVDYVESDGIPLIRASDISKGSLNFSEVRYISLKQHESLTKYRKVEKGDILVSKSGTLGTCCIVNVDKEFSIYESIIAIKTKKNILNSKYLLQLLKDNYTLSRMLNNKVGGAVGHLNLKTFKQLLIVVPTIEEQEKIASILSTVDEEIDNVDALIEKNKELKKGLMQTLLTKGIGHTKFKKTEIGEIPEEWEVKKLKDICNVKGGKRLPKGFQLEDNNNGFPYIRVADMYMGGIKLNDIKYVPYDAVEKIKNYNISKNDLFISVAGTLGIVGEVPDELDNANLTENADKLCDINMNKKFLLKVLQSQVIQKIIDAEKTSNAQPKLALTRIKEFMIPIPSREEQEKIASILSSVDKKIDEYEKKKERLEELKKGLMQQLLIGKIRLK